MRIGWLYFIAVLIPPFILLFYWFRNGAGPDWMWRLGKDDPMRNIFFRQNGTWRRFGKLGMLIALSIIPTLIALRII